MIQICKVLMYLKRDILLKQNYYIFILLIYFYMFFVFVCFFATK